MAPQLAWHFEAAGMVDKALGYLVQAARRADWLLGLAEMNTYITRTMRMLPALPDPLRRAAYEFYHQNLLAETMVSVDGCIAPEAGQAWGRAYDLAEYMEHIPTRWYALKRLADYHRQGGALRLARQYGQRAIDLSQDQDPLLLTVAQANQAQTLLLSGDFGQASEYLEPLYVPCLPPQSHCPGFVFQDHCNFLAHAPWVLWCQGYPERALRVSQALLAAAKASEFAVNIVQALCDAVCFLHQLRCEVAPTEQALHGSESPSWATYNSCR